MLSDLPETVPLVLDADVTRAVPTIQLLKLIDLLERDASNLSEQHFEHPTGFCLLAARSKPRTQQNSSWGWPVDPGRLLLRADRYGR